ncbi:Uncharacterized protein SCF082_LOCUS47863 [Durusdinium trenchii]|uniref:Uncharacterized protein n=1 Tax=Durusdinium trenchii TaxID=1381693 RepID=A0ABP0RP35_9DINO
MTTFDPLHLSGRIKGIVKSMANNKRPLQQARALYKEEVQALEDVVLDCSHHPCIRIIAGYLLFCFVACCRFSDPMYALDWQVSESGNIVLIEARTRVHKTAHVHSRQSVFLPLVGLGRIFREQSWAKNWMDLREEHLRNASPFILPAFSEQTSEWVNRAMIASEGALWLRDIVATYRITGSSLTTHGLKATLLTWVTIRALGHHVDPGSRAPLTYSRDNAVGLQVPLAMMLRTMADGTFDPDLPRAAQVDRQVNQLLMEVGATDDGFVVGLRPPTAVDEVMSDGTDVDNALDIEDGADQAELDVVCIDAEKAAGLVTQHRSSGVLHFVASHDKLTCGRKISKAYAIVEEDLVVKWPLCRQCRRSGGEELVAQVCPD